MGLTEFAWRGTEKQAVQWSRGVFSAPPSWEGKLARLTLFAGVLCLRFCSCQSRLQIISWLETFHENIASYWGGCKKK